jgi:hypothetical protein
VSFGNWYRSVCVCSTGATSFTTTWILPATADGPTTSRRVDCVVGSHRSGDSFPMRPLSRWENGNTTTPVGNVSAPLSFLRGVRLQVPHAGGEDGVTVPAQFRQVRQNRVLPHPGRVRADQDQVSDEVADAVDGGVVRADDDGTRHGVEVLPVPRSGGTWDCGSPRMDCAAGRVQPSYHTRMVNVGGVVNATTPFRRCC